MEAVNVFPVIDCLNDLLLGNMLGQRKLDDKAVHISILIELLHLGQELLFGHITFKTNQGRREATYFARLHLGSDIRLASSIVTYQNGRQVRTFSTGRHYAGHFGSNLLLDLLRYCFSINQCHTFSRIKFQVQKYGIPSYLSQEVRHL